MISLAGNCLLIFAIISSILVMKVNGLLRLRLAMTMTPRFLFFISNLAIILSFLLLVFAFVNSDFSIRNVFLNSSTIKPLIYKIAGSWASHEGSILLYLTLLSTLSSIFIKKSNYSDNTQNLQITILAFIQILFLCFVYFTSNPFDNFMFVPNQGLGLNPVLQDKALSIHPPLLYMGYVTYVATYVNAILLLLRPKDRQNILRNNLYFSGLALAALTSGIGLGSWWAYRELGWGGYWFFDPVENISLMPWLVGIALHHFLLISNKHSHDKQIKVLNWSICTSILAFLLTIYGIFFVRSGVISSVHSFAFSAERGLYLFLISLILTLLAIIAFIARQDKDRAKAYNTKLTIKDKSIIAGNILWLLAFGSLFIALIYPIYYSFFYNIDIAIDPEYFQKIFIPIFIPIILLAAIAPYLPNKLSFQNLIHVLISAIILGIFHYYINNLGVISAFIMFVSVFLMIQMVYYGLIETKYFQASINSRKFSLIMGHFSLAMLAFSVTMNVVLSKEIEFIGKIGDSVSNSSFSVKLNDIKFSDSNVYYRQIAEFSVADNNGNIVILKPENRLYKIENTLSQESDIYSYITHDIFAVLSKINGDTIHAIIYYRPMIYFIWLSLFLMSATFCVYIFRRRGCFM